MALKVVDPSSKDLKAAGGEVYYKPFIDRALEIGLIKTEYDEVPQYVERMMPRELAVQVIDRALAMKGETVTADHGLEYKFKDYSMINDVNKEAVLKAYQLGIIKGSNGNFEPKNLLTRAEAAVLISKLMDKTLRDKLTFSINPKVFDEVSEWYMNDYDAITGRRTVVIEKKEDGSINNGGKDYFEARKWWSDQEFENLISTGIKDRTLIDIANSIIYPKGCTMEEIKQTNMDLKLQGGYFVRDGEINIMNYDYYEPNGFKFYDAEIDNINRMIYDLAKYTVQFAKENGKFANMYTGLRLGELLGLRESDVDLKRREVKVRGSIRRTKEGLVYQKPKTISSIRTVPIPSSIIPILKDYMILVNEQRIKGSIVYNDCGLFFKTDIWQYVRSS